jgi:mannose-6-phosphate isomerase-like protein (cupin superfamily)
MLIKKSERKLEKISNEGNVWDYPVPNEEVGIALQELNGAVPDKGWHKNTVCYEICYIISGEAVFFVGDEKYNVVAGDVVIIKPQVKSRIEAENLSMITVTKPNWYEEQCQLVKD